MRMLNKTGYILLGAAMVLIGGSVATAGALSVQPTNTQIVSTSTAETLESSKIPASSSIIISHPLIEPDSKIISSAPKGSDASKMDNAATSNIQNTQPTSSASPALKSPEPDKYGIINPKTGEPVSTQDANYEAYKAELGGDAGTVPPANSKAVQAVLEKIKNTSSYFAPPQPKIGDQAPNP